MQITIKGTQIDLTPAIVEYIEERIKPLEKYIGRFEEQGESIANVEIARTTLHHRHGEVYTVDVNLYLDGEVIRASRSGEDMRATIDEVKDVLKGEIQKFKDLRVDKPISDAQKGSE